MEHKTSFIVIFSILVIFGLIVLASATSVVGYENFGDNYHYLKHQIFYGFLPGLFLFLLFSKIRYKFWQKNAWWLFLFTIILLILVFVPNVGLKINRAKSWIKIGGVVFQPSEIAKLTLLIYLAAFFASAKEHIKSFSHGFLPFLIFLGIIAGLTVLQPDLGTTSIIVLIAVGIYFVAGARLSHLFSLVLIGSGFFALLISADHRRLDRILTFLNPNANVLKAGYHINQALIAIGSGGLLGLGLGHSRQKFEYLPQVIGDSIFAVLAEELGFIFSVLFIILLVYFIFKILKISKYAKSDFAKIFAVGMAVWIGGQTLINVGSMIRILPLTGVPLPFISYGGTALMSLMAGCGILLNIISTES